MRRETFPRGAIEVDLGNPLDLSWTPWRFIPLSAKDPSLRALVDAVDYDELSQFVWNIWHGGGRNAWQLYAKRNVGPSRATVRMHRVVMIAADPQGDEFLASHVVDHINRQTLDNRRANLRWLTARGNVFNRGDRGSAPSIDDIARGLIASLTARPVLEEIPFP